MLDIKRVRKEPDVYTESYKRMKNPELLTQLDDLIEKDKRLRKVKVELDQIRSERNTLILTASAQHKFPPVITLSNLHTGNTLIHTASALRKFSTVNAPATI